MINILQYLKSNKNFIARLVEQEKKIHKLTTEYKILSEINETLVEKATPELVIEKILKRELEWYDPKELDQEGRKNYYIEAQAILRSPVFQNEKNAYIKDLVDNIATKSPNHDHTIALRYSINGVQTLWERFKAIKDPETTPKKPAEEPYAPI